MGSGSKTQWRTKISVTRITKLFRTQKWTREISLPRPMTGVVSGYNLVEDSVAASYVQRYNTILCGTLWYGVQIYIDDKNVFTLYTIRLCIYYILR